MQRNELIEKLVPPLIEKGSTREGAIAILDTYTLDELHQHYYKQLAKERGEQPPQSKPVTWADVEQAKTEAREKLHRQQIEFETQRALDDEAWVMEREKANLPQRIAQSKQDLIHDKSVFQDAARVLRSFAVNEANLNVLRSVLGAGNLSVFAIQKAIQTGQVSLTAPTEEQLNEYHSEDVERHNQRLLQATPDQLRQQVRQEAEARRAAAVAAETEAAEKARAERDQQMGFPPLPETWLGQPLNSTFIKRASKETLKTLVKRFGPNSVTNRLRGIDSAQPKGEQQ